MKIEYVKRKPGSANIFALPVAVLMQRTTIFDECGRCLVRHVFGFSILCFQFCWTATTPKSITTE